MVHFAASSMFFHEYPCDEVFDLVTEAGFDAIEFWPETPDFWLRGQPVAELAAVIARNPSLVEMSVHAPVLDLNPCSVNPGVAALSIKYSLQALDMAESIGASIFTVHPGRRTAKRVPSGADYDRFERYVRELGKASAGKGIRVAMENMEPVVNSLLCTPGAVRELLDREPWLFFTLDLSHGLAGSRHDVDEYISRCHERLVHVHVSLADHGRLHLPVAGNRTIAGILSELAGHGFDGLLTLEIEDRNFDHDLSAEEKVLLLSKDLRFIEKFFA